ncbi:tyrosine-protein phosphatase [Microbacterium sp. zg.Y625]|uniref:tyrosine-protein phosphatase n=1 Tax=Microbacterium jiangjiandongii TaxID=3049071 RepID=UPI00214AB39E|nr:MULTISPECIES: tyrosine-protein phosphatase [unclassified Microbacterium]MCR2794256.1 tyrosine-protein phosphatase [Microbacterium sp. zg.Y625]WIM25452.1 tyrosine-protein phosphatase [Microbacterium sp. zg-Y625]
MPVALSVDGLANARDLGGMERSDGSLTPTGVFVRAEMLDRLDESGWAVLRDHGVRTVIDLRRPEEATGSVPDDMLLVRLDLDGDERDFWAPLEADGRWGTPLYYAAHLQQLPHRLAQVVDAIASAPRGAVVFHCGAGWDRTGLVAAFLLKAIGVSEDAAVADYLVSFANADAMTALHGRSFDVEERHAVLAAFGHTPESAFRGMYRELDVDEWFRHAGVGEDAVRAIVTWRGHVDARPQ